MVLMVGIGILFMLGWDPLVHHVGLWDTGTDLWGIFRGAHSVALGFLGGIYLPANGVVAFPGVPVILAPVAMLGDSLHLTEAAALVAHPTVALILQPVELLLASTVVFAADALAERLQVGNGRRISLCFLVAIIAWPTAAIWGHAEDALAMTFTMYAMVALLDRRWSGCGWLLGCGIVIQPLVALTLPLFIGAAPPGRRLLLAVRSAALSVVLVGVAFVGNAAGTYRQLVTQPTPPSVNHPTPWMALAPKVTSGGMQTIRQVIRLSGRGVPAFTVVTSTVHPVVEVAGGPGRLIDVAVALLLGLYVWRRPQHAVRLLWLVAVILASRCFFEAVMTPYYIAPPLFLGLVLAARQGAKRFWAAAVIAIEITVFAYHHLNPWVWWVPVVAGLAAVLALGYPSDVSEAVGSPAEAPPEPTSPGLEVEPRWPTRHVEPALQR
jgi:hypothetical protein